MVVEFGVAREVRRLPEGFTPLFWVCTLVESCAVVAQGREVHSARRCHSGESLDEGPLRAEPLLEGSPWV